MDTTTRSVPPEQIRRFEAAMVDGRRWRASAFATLVVAHPTLGKLAAQLVWVVFDAQGSAVGSFRVDAAGSLTDVDDRAVELPADALVGIAHPLHLGDTLTPWRERFAALGLHQPFDQLARGVYDFTPEEAASNRLSRFADRQAQTARVWSARWRGWAVSNDRISRRLGRSLEVVVPLDPGFRGGYSYEARTQRIVAVQLLGGTFGELDPVTASELLRQLERLAAVD